MWAVNREVLRLLYESYKNSHWCCKDNRDVGTLCRCNKLDRFRPLIIEAVWLREGLVPRSLSAFENSSLTWCWYLCVFQENPIRFHYTFTSEGTAFLRMLFKAECIHIYLLSQENKILYFFPSQPVCLFVCLFRKLHAINSELFS